MLVAKQKFSTATLNFLPVGHTHEDIDLLWAVVMARILNKFNIQTPDEFVQLEWNVRCLPCQRLVCDAVGLERVRDFQLWLKPWGIHVCNCFKLYATVGYLTTSHVFIPVPVVVD